MSNRVTESNLQAIVNRLNKLTGNPLESYVKDASGKYVSQVGNYHLDFAYGGVKLVQIDNPSGGVRDTLRCGYVTKPTLQILLFAFIEGICTEMERKDREAA